MRVVFDLQALQNESRDRGIGRYVHHLFHALSQRSEIVLYGLLNSALSEHFEEAEKLAKSLVGAERTLVFNGIAPTRAIEDENIARGLCSELIYESFLDSLEFDVLLVGSLFEGFEDSTTISLKGDGYEKYVVLFDLIPLLNPTEFFAWDKVERWYKSRLDHLTGAQMLLAISASANQEGVDNLTRDPATVRTIGTATDRSMFNEDQDLDQSILDRLGIDRPFVMHASALDERKNFAGLIRAYAKLPPKLRQTYRLVLVGKGTEAAKSDLADIVNLVGLDADEVIFTGYVADADLAHLYRQCTLFIFPSFHEGFGLPALEAMSCGCPTIGSTLSSIPEVIGRDDLLFDPADPTAMSSLMRRLLEDKTLLDEVAEHSRFQAKTFKWELVAEKAIAALLDAKPSGRTPIIPIEHKTRRIASKISKFNLADHDLEQLANAITRNELQAFKQVGRIAAETGRRWRIEGPFDSSYSLALLNRETARALKKLGFNVALHSTEGPGDFAPNPHYLALHPDLARMNEEANLAPTNSEIVSRLLFPPRVGDMDGGVRALHHYAWEESGFPQQWVNDFNQNLTLMTCLSRHVEKIMIDNGVTVPMLTSGCGVDHWDRITADPNYRVSGKSFRFLHVSSCFPRKGADTLLAAYGAAFTSKDDVTLIIKTFDNPHNDISSQLALLKRNNPSFPDVRIIFDDVTETQLKAIYEQCDVMVGPSCAEGYGLPFAEAMLSGLPVITTNWGGQLDFCNEGNSWLLDYEFERAETHFGLWSSLWARVKPGELAQALRIAEQAPIAVRREMAARGRSQLMSAHRWEHVALRLSAATSLLTNQVQRKPKIGWMSTWGSRCGIATYSSHLLENIGLESIIFAPVNEEHRADHPLVNRCWTFGAKVGQDYGDILARSVENGVEILVIQFNYGFYDHNALSRLIERCGKCGIQVVITLHSTVDPAEPRKDLFHLKWLGVALARCARVLVHSPADMNRLKELGLVDNVTLFPHAVLEYEPDNRLGADSEVICSYGFALPNKGLEQIVEATALLHKRGRPVRLRLVNAEYPSSASTNLIADLKRRVKLLGLQDAVEHHHDFLADEESLRLIQGSDLAVFAYQQTGESASGAVRYGLAAQVPVAVTPLGIFDDLGSAVFRMQGISPSEIADGIERALDGNRAATAEANLIGASAASWREQHAYSAVSRRLKNMIVALALRSSSGPTSQPGAKS